MRMLWDQTLEWTYPDSGTAKTDRSSDTLIFYLEKTDPRGAFVPEKKGNKTLVEVGRVQGPNQGGSVSVTINPPALGLSRDTRYERAVKVDDGGTERTLEQDLLFVRDPRVKSN